MKQVVIEGVTYNLVIAEEPKTKRPKLYTKAEIDAGLGWPCTAPKPCSRKLRSIDRAAVHATPKTLQKKGHLSA